MCEEDRQTALAMYGRCFDDAVDEQQLMDLLVSPTRQAVVIARTYNAKERRQQLEEHAAGKPETEMPGFMLAIDKLYQQVAPPVEERVAPAVEAEPAPPAQAPGQFSLFPDEPHPIADEEYIDHPVEAAAVSITEPVEELPVEASPAAPQPRPEPEPLPQEPVQVEVPAEPEPDAQPVPVEVPDASEPVQAEAPAEPQPLAFQDETAVQLPVEKAVLAQDAPAEPVQVQPVSELAVAPERGNDLDIDHIPATRQEARVFLLILYILVAVPVVLAGIVLLLIPTVLTLALAVTVVAAGAATLVAAFSGFPKLADILIVLGTAVIVLALGLLALWLFVWFIGGAIGGLIRGAIALGRKWCFKEVPV